MALIPPDAAIRMRMQTEANLLQPVRPAHEVPSDLPELQPGQTFSARIQETLPDNTYRALVAGKQLTLQLPEGAKAGDQLDLVVLDRSAKVIIARQVEPGGTAAASGEAAPYAYARFSPAARMIGQLLPAEGETPSPTALNRGQPLLTPSTQGQHMAAQLAPALGKAVAQSGLFYEAHQAQWVNGKLPLANLLQEPQGQRSLPVAHQLAAAEIAAQAISTAGRPITANMILQALQTVAQPPGNSSSPITANTVLQALQTVAQPSGNSSSPITANMVLQAVAQALASSDSGQSAPPQSGPLAAQLSHADITTAFQKAVDELARQVATGPARQDVQNSSNPNNPGRADVANSAAQSGQPSTLAQQVPNDLRPLVQQQLEAAASNRMVWHGEVWPRQPMDWEIEWDGEREADGSTEEDARWRTALSLTTPRLGRVSAHLQLTAHGVNITLATPSDSSANDLRDAAPALAEALSAAGVPLLGFKVKFENEYPAGQG